MGDKLLPHNQLWSTPFSWHTRCGRSLRHQGKSPRPERSSCMRLNHFRDTAIAGLLGAALLLGSPGTSDAEPGKGKGNGKGWRERGEKRVERKVERSKGRGKVSRSVERGVEARSSARRSSSRN